MKARILALAMLLLLSGCWDLSELEENGYVIALGFDATDQEDSLQITYQIANPQVGASDRVQGGQEKAYGLVTIMGPDYITGQNLVSATITRELTYDHIKTIIISEQLARSDQFLPMIQSLMRSEEISRNINLIITKESAKEFLESNQPMMETRPHKFFSFFQERWKELGLVPTESSLGNYLQVTEADASLFTAIYATTKPENQVNKNSEDEYVAGEIPLWNENKTQVFGAAVFKNGKMIDVITGEDTRLIALLQKNTQVKSMKATYPDPLKKNVTVSAVIREIPGADIKIKTEQPFSIDVTVPIGVEVVAIKSHINYAEDLKKQEILRNSIEDALNQKAETFIQKTQETYQAEPFQWGSIAKKKFLTLNEYQKFNWMKSYPDAKVNVRFNVTLLDFGRQIPPAKLKEIKD